MTKKDTNLQIQEADSTTAVERTKTGKVFVPAVDIYETEKEIVVLADMPGVDEKNIDITLEKNILSIKGNVDAFSPKNYTLGYSEYQVGDYERSFTIDHETIDRDNIKAQYQNGVLTLHLLKAEPMQPKKISVAVA